MNKLMTAKEQAILLAVTGAVLIGAAAIYLTRESGPPHHKAATETNGELQSGPPPESQRTLGQAPPLDLQPFAAPTSQDVIPPRTVTVSIVGAIHNPDVYILPEGSRINDIVEKAGGVLEDAELVEINLAAVLIDGTTLTIPSTTPRGFQETAERNIAAYTVSGQQSATASGATDTLGSAGVPAPTGENRVDLNTATQEQLEGLPGIGNKLATAIINYRIKTPFSSIDDLNNVPGIGTKKIDGVRSLVTVGKR